MSVTQATWATERVVARARKLWDDGERTADIGRAVGVSRDTIVGYARRHHWPPHPHQPWGGIHRRRKLGQPPGLEPQQKAVRRHVSTRPIPKPKPAVAALKVACRPDVLAVPSPPHRSCQWPFGEPRTRGFRFCEATPVLEGKPYCRAHSEIAYHRAPRWHADAPA